MNRTAFAALFALAAFAARPALAQFTAYTTTNNGQTLVRFQTDSPGNVTVVGGFSGAVTAVDALDFRPSDGRLYGVNNVGDVVVIIDTATAATALVSALSVPINQLYIGADFDPASDRLRVVSAISRQNLSVDVDTGQTVAGGTLGYAPGDPNEGAAFGQNDVAYTTGGARLYYLDAAQDVLATTADPESGVLTTVGELGFNPDISVGFDIVTAGGADRAFAVLNPIPGTSGLYEIDLNGGTATRLGDLPDVNFYGLALAPVAAVPGPAALPLCALGFSALALCRRRN